MENTPIVDGAVVPKKNVLFEVTLLSTVLTTILFIVLPFVGFWIGIQYNIVNLKTSPELNNVFSSPEIDVPQATASQTQQDLEVTNYESNGFTVINGEVVYQTEYSKAQKVEALDTASFQPLNTAAEGKPLGLLYAKDTNSIVVGDHLGTVLIIADAEPSTFTVLKQNFARDDKSVFTVVETGGGDSYKPRIVKIRDADPSTFVVLGSGYAKDKSNVYFSAWNQKVAQIVTDADPTSFIVTDIKSYYDADNFKAKDENNFFDFGKIVTED